MRTRGARFRLGGPLAALLLAAATAHAAFLVRPDDLVAICGDSITEQRIYSVFVEDYLLMCQPTPGQRIAEFGWGGEHADGLTKRLASDVLPFKPTVVTTCYGMNDGNYVPATPAIVDAYRANQEALLSALRQGGVRDVLVAGPGCVDTAVFAATAHAWWNKTTTADEYNENLRQLGEAARDVARKAGAAFADVHAPMMDAMAKSKAAYGDAYLFAGRDGIHPGANGGLVMAGAILKGLGCDGAVGTITVDLASGKAEGTAGQKIVSAADGTVVVESTRYPFCFTGDPEKPDPTAAAILKFTSFNDDLNRYLLVVQGLKGARAKVTWSNADKTAVVSREFDAADLAKGVNLAAAFAAGNPFAAPFAKVDAAVQKQQGAETPLVKTLLHGIPALKDIVPGQEAAFGQIVAGAVKQDEALFQAAAALVVPVRHTITVEAVPQG